jgi:hypothetical protein
MKPSNLSSRDSYQKKNWQVFDINKDTTNGPDLTIARNGKSYRVEIKKACKSTRSWKTTPVGKSGKQCDLVIIILPNNDLLIQPMNEHLSLCSKNGARMITELVEVNL